MSLKSAVLRPILERLGTALAMFLVGKSIADPSLINEFVAALVALILITSDLVISYAARKRDERHAEDDSADHYRNTLS